MPTPAGDLRIQEGEGPAVAMRKVGDSFRQIVETIPADSAGIDGFGRQRVSETVLLLDSKRVGAVPDVFMTQAVTGTGAAVYAADRASTTLTVGPAAGSVTRQTKVRAVYQPGKSLLVFQTFVCGAPQPGLVQEIGYFDGNNGVFLRYDNDGPAFVIRSHVSGAPVDTVVRQADWNVDRLDGHGPSAITIDCQKAQILVLDCEWLGVGRVRIGMVVDGIPVYAHQFLNANTTLTNVYMSNPNLPLRWRIEATEAIAGTASLEAICGTVASEGGYEITGVTASVDSPVQRSVAAGATAEILAVRMRSEFTEFATAFAQSFSLLNISGGAFRWRLVLNPTEATAGAWSNVNGSILEVNHSSTITPATGIVLASGFVSSNTNNITIEARPVLTLGTTLAGVTDVLSLQVSNLTNNADNFYGALTWREVF
jgi:hypothetical protein